jgi:phosphonate transport system substrate-binding protein
MRPLFLCYLLDMKTYWIILITLLIGCRQAEPLGSKNNPIKLYFNPIEESGVITNNSKEFLKFLEKETGYHFKTGITASYIALVEALGTARVDIARISPNGYLIANEKYGAEAKLKIIRDGVDFYRGQIITRVDSDIKTVKDLNGRKFAFTDPSSTSGFMFPKKLLNDNKIDLGETFFARKHANVVSMVYQKQVEAGAAFHSTSEKTGEVKDARRLVKTQFPDVAEKIKTLALTDKIPNEPFAFRKGLDPQISTKFIAAMKKFASTKEGNEIFRTDYNLEGVVDATDSDYDTLRDVIKTIKVDLK